MKLDANMNRWAGLLVLLLVMVIVYFMFFHNFIVEHAGLNESIDELNSSRQKYINQAAKAPALKTKLKEVKQQVGSNDEFLKAETKNLGNAELTSLFKNVFNEQGVERDVCQIISQQPTQDRDLDQFEKIVLRVRMRCQYEVFAKILASLEENTPSLFINDLRLEARNVSRYRRKGADAAPTVENLEVRFELYAYLKNPIEKDDEK